MDLPCAGPAGGVRHVLPQGGPVIILLVILLILLVILLILLMLLIILLIILSCRYSVDAWMTLVILLLRRRLDDGHCCGHFGAFFRTCVGSARNRDARVGRAAGVP